MTLSKKLTHFLSCLYGSSWCAWPSLLQARKLKHLKALLAPNKSSRSKIHLHKGSAEVSKQTEECYKGADENDRIAAYHLWKYWNLGGTKQM